MTTHLRRVAPVHDWWDWYAAYIPARPNGDSLHKAAESAGRYKADVKHITVASATCV